MVKVSSRKTARQLPSVGRVYNQLRLQGMMLTMLLKLARPLLKLSRYLLKLARPLFNLGRPVRMFARPLMNPTRIILNKPVRIKMWYNKTKTPCLAVSQVTWCNYNT